MPKRKLSMDAEPARIALLGSGTVGLAVLRRLAEWQGTPIARNLKLVFAGNRRLALNDPDGLDALDCASLLVNAPDGERRSHRSDALRALGHSGTRILIDATACAETAALHADCLRSGIHVATACKLAAGTSLEQWRAIHEACLQNGVAFGDRATVGAGLPLLRSIRELRAGGDTIHAIAGVMSGSLAWLFQNFDGSRPFSVIVREARERGLTEPDPRDDLSGEDLRRKILILARAAGFEIDHSEVAVSSLVPPALSLLDMEDLDGSLHLLDAPMASLLADARAANCTLAFVARFNGKAARVKLEQLRAGDPLNGGAGTDNRVAIWSDRYSAQPLVIQGPGAGAEVTAAALLDDVLELRSLSPRAKLAA
jgi:homoserine dehydrogenase